MVMAPLLVVQVNCARDMAGSVNSNSSGSDSDFVTAGIFNARAFMAYHGAPAVFTEALTFLICASLVTSITLTIWPHGAF
jgi:hypothetical protein